MRRRGNLYCQLFGLFVVTTLIFLKFYPVDTSRLLDVTRYPIGNEGVDTSPIKSQPTPVIVGGGSHDRPKGPIPSAQPADTTQSGERVLKDKPTKVGSDNAAETVKENAKTEKVASDVGKDQDQDGKSHKTTADAKGDDGSKTDNKSNDSDSDNSHSDAKDKLPKEQLVKKAKKILKSVLDANDTSIDRMSCPPINTTRYGYLKAAPWSGADERKYFFALNLRQVVDLLPRLLGSIVEAMHFLGPHACALSIVEGNSDDGTLEVLEMLRPELERMGVYYYLRSSYINPSENHRIERLAALRQEALEPLTGPVPVPVRDLVDEEVAQKMKTDGPATSAVWLEQQRPHPARLNVTSDATVIFLNDVAACAEDILELVHQRVFQSADMTCGMDWRHEEDAHVFYDIWVARLLNGDVFFPLPLDTDLNVVMFKHDKMFSTDSVTQARAEAGRTFQVFACWNGGVAFAAEPLVKAGVNFRWSREGECFMGEPTLFCKDLWWAGYGRIAVVPSVNFQYTDESGRRIKKELGYVSEWVAREAEDPHGKPDLRISWKGPPDEVLCMPDFVRQNWTPWNETLGDGW